MSRILVVEDNALSRKLVRTLLEHHGHTVEEAISTESARAALAAGVFELVIMDIQFPGGGGEALLKELHSRPPPPDRALRTERQPPILAVTAHAMAGDRERLLEQGFDGYIGKPIDTREFMIEVERLLETRRGAS
jgi:CheY-like chemotaxis protein